MFPSTQSAKHKYERDCQFNPHPPETQSYIIQRIALNLFTSPDIRDKLARYWLQFALEDHTSMISFLFTFCKVILESPIDLKVNSNTFNLFQMPKYAVALEFADPFDRDIMQALLKKDHNKFFSQVSGTSPHINAEEFKYNDVLEQHFDRWQFVQWLFHRLLHSEQKRIFTLKDVLICVARRLRHVETSPIASKMKPPPGISPTSVTLTDTLLSIVANFKTWK
jgi:hypothetical protein|tara:strand:+ start:3432 stop:4100 length:669 start_codon:yes stop_codon:yes gene_type:complete